MPYIVHGAHAVNLNNWSNTYRPYYYKIQALKFPPQIDSDYLRLIFFLEKNPHSWPLSQLSIVAVHIYSSWLYYFITTDDGLNYHQSWPPPQALDENSSKKLSLALFHGSRTFGFPPKLSSIFSNYDYLSRQHITMSTQLLLCAKKQWLMWWPWTTVQRKRKN